MTNVDQAPRLIRVHSRPFAARIKPDRVPRSTMASGVSVSAAYQDLIDIAFVRRRTGMAHVFDPDALTAFSDGRGVFDIDPHGRWLDAFIAKHKLEARVESEDLLPGQNEMSAKRPVLYAAALWQKRNPARQAMA